MLLGMGGLAPLNINPITCPGIFPEYWPEQKDKDWKKNPRLPITDELGRVISILPTFPMPEA